MTIKKWLYVCIFSFCAFFVSIVFIVNIFIDPYGEYSLITTPLNKEKFYQTYETTPFILAKKLEQNPYALVFGSSHSATISEKLLGEPILNFSSNLYGHAIDVYHFLNSLTEKQLKNITKIYFLVDLKTFLEKKSLYETVDVNSSFSFFLNTIKNINCLKIMRALECVLKNITGKYANRILDDGTLIHLQEMPFRPGKYFDFIYSDKGLEHLTKVDSFCASHGIEIVYFKSVFSTEFLRKIDFDTLTKHYMKILEAIPKYYAFTYLENFSEDLSYFRDDSHHGSFLTKKECELLSSPEEAKKYEITKANIDYYLSNLKAKQKI